MQRNFSLVSQKSHVRYVRCVRLSISNTSNLSNLSNTGKKDKKPSLYIYNKITNYTLNNISTINAAIFFLSCLKKTC